MFGLGTQELILILIIVLVIFGAGKLPQVGSSIGKAVRNFKEGIRDNDEPKTETKVADVKPAGDERKSA